MKLYYSPGACSVGVHILLEETGKPFELERINLREGAHHTPEYRAISAKGKVPALRRDDGSVLTEYGAIATWIARSSPEAGLIPSDPDAEARAVEALEYCVATVHMQGFTRIARPGNFSADPAQTEAVKARGREIYAQGLALLDKQLEGREWIAGPYSVGDTALFYVANWAPRAGVELPGNVAAHYARMKARPAVQRALASESQPS